MRADVLVRKDLALPANHDSPERPVTVSYAEFPGTRLGHDPDSQRVAQAAAWHFCDEKSWDELQGIIVRRLARPDQSFFSFDEIERAKLLVESLEAAAETGGKRDASSIALTR